MTKLTSADGTYGRRSKNPLSDLFFTAFAGLRELVMSILIGVIPDLKQKEGGGQGSLDPFDLYVVSCLEVFLVVLSSI